MIHSNRSRLSFASLAVLALMTSACGSSNPPPKEPPPPVTGSLARTLTMVDKDGKIYGTVELDPLGGGKVVDADGRVVGTIVAPNAPHHSPASSDY